MIFDIPLLYPKKLFNNGEFLFYLVKNDYIKTFKSFFNDLDIDLKNKKDIDLIKKLFKFSLTNKSLKIHNFIFSKVVDICNKKDFYFDILSYLIKKGTLNNSDNIQFYKQEIGYKIKFYNTPSCNYKTKLYPECKKSHDIFTRDYEFLVSYLITHLNKKNIDNIFTLYSIFYYDRQFTYNRKIISFCVNNNNPELLQYYIFNKFTKNCLYYKENVFEIAFEEAAKNDNFEFIEYFEKNINENISRYYTEYILKVIISNESIKGLNFLQKHPSVLYDSILEAYNQDTFDYLFRFNRFQNIEFISSFFEILNDIYKKTFVLQTINYIFSEEQLKTLSDVFFRISSEAICYSNYENFWNVFIDKFSFDFLSNEQIKKILDKYYKNKNALNRIKLVIESSMKNSSKKEKAIEALNKYFNANKIRNF